MKWFWSDKGEKKGLRADVWSALQCPVQVSAGLWLALQCISASQCQPVGWHSSAQCLPGGRPGPAVASAVRHCVQRGCSNVPLANHPPDTHVRHTCSRMFAGLARSREPSACREPTPPNRNEAGCISTSTSEVNIRLKTIPMEAAQK